MPRPEGTSKLLPPPQTASVEAAEIGRVQHALAATAGGKQQHHPVLLRPPCKPMQHRFIPARHNLVPLRPHFLRMQYGSACTWDPFVPLHPFLHRRGIISFPCGIAAFQHRLLSLQPFIVPFPCSIVPFPLQMLKTGTVVGIGTWPGPSGRPVADACKMGTVVVLGTVAKTFARPFCKCLKPEL